MSGMIRTLPATWSLPRLALRRIIWPANMAGIVLIVGIWLVWQLVPYWGDAHGYWYSTQPGVDWYARRWNVDPDAFVYGPPVALAFKALTWMPWPLFYGVWTATLLAAAVWLMGPALTALLLVPELPLRHEIQNGNLNLLIAVALVLALRGHASAWSFGLLTKVTPGIGLVWHAARREWRALGVALSVTLAIALVTVLVVPDAWSRWISLLLAGGPTIPGAFATVPFAVRAIAAVVLVAMAARGNHPWLVPLAVWFTLPNWAVWPSLVILAASVKLYGPIPRLADYLLFALLELVHLREGRHSIS